MSERIRVELGKKSYDILVGKTLLARAGEEIAAIARGVVPVVTDSTVASLHLEGLLGSLKKAGVKAEPIVLPPGEDARVSAHCCQIATRDRENARQPASHGSRGPEIAG